MEIQINYDEIEHLARLLHQIMLDADDLVMRCKALRTEMETDVEFMAVPEGGKICEMLEEATFSVMQTYETAVSLHRIVDETPDLFRGQERSFVDRINELSVQLESIGAQMDSIMMTDQLILEERKSTQETAINLERLVTSETLSLEILNIGAIKKAVNSGYPVRHIKDMEL